MLCGRIHVPGTVGAVNGRRVPPGGGVAVLDPAGLYRLEPDAPALDDPVLVVVLDGFVDAGAAARLASIAARRGRGAARWRASTSTSSSTTAPGGPRCASRPTTGSTTPRPSWTSSRSPTPPAPAYLLLTRPRAGLAVGAVRRRARGARAHAQRAPRGQPDGDPDGGAAHPPDRRHGARHAPRADRGPRGAVRDGARCRAAPSALSSSGSGRPGTRRWGSPCTCRTTWRARSTRRPPACWSTTWPSPTGPVPADRGADRRRPSGPSARSPSRSRVGGGRTGRRRAGAAVRHGDLRRAPGGPGRRRRAAQRGRAGGGGGAVPRRARRPGRARRPAARTPAPR